MKLVVRRAKPKTVRERFFRAEAEANDAHNPAEAWVVIDGKEYIIELHFDRG